MNNFPIKCQACGDDFFVTQWRANHAKYRPKFCCRECADGRPKNPQLRIAKFWQRVDKGPHPKGCWLWTGCTYNAGYGSFHWRNKMRGANRVAYEVHHGTQIPDNLDVLHSCDVPLCVNPAHLRLGTHFENMADAKAKGRNTFGTKNRAAKLNDDKVRDILRQKPTVRRGGRKLALSLAAHHGVAVGIIYAVWRRAVWKHVQLSPSR